jgi:hypothetical protein
VRPYRPHPGYVTPLVAALLAGPLAAQEAPLVLEIYGGAATPLGTFADGSRRGEGSVAGPSLSVLFARPGVGRRTLYAGFSQHRFGCEDAGCVSNGRYVATGFDLGMRFALVTGHAAIPWIRLGAITTRVETDDLGGEDSGVSDLGWGGEVGLGVYLGAARTLAINPGVRFAAVNTELPGGSLLRMRFLVAQIAAAIAF